MAELKTKETRASVAGFLKQIADQGVRKDCETLIVIMKSASKSEPKMWGTAIVGFAIIHVVMAFLVPKSLRAMIIGR